VQGQYHNNISCIEARKPSRGLIGTTSVTKLAESRTTIFFFLKLHNQTQTT
jgi:hypothetical protein